MYDSLYDDRPVRPAPRPSVAGPLVMWLAVTVAAGVLIWHFWPSRGGLLNPDAQPRAVTPRGDLAEDEKASIALYDAAFPSVVHIDNLTDRSEGFNLNVQQERRGSGSGFVWDEDGHIVTNLHVVQGASAVHVFLADHSSYEARPVGVYADKDLAVLKIDAPRSKLKPIPIGTSHDLKVGQKAFVIGNPFGLDGTYTTGIISALGREIQDQAASRPIRGVIQTSAPINPGNSGGVLLDSAGRLVGVTTAILSPSGAFAGIGFAIPVDEVNRIVPELIAQGKITRPRLGVELAPDQQAQKVGVADGALILSVVKNSPADKAGLHGSRIVARQRLQLGDIIVAVDDKPIHSGNDLFSALESHKVGDAVTVAFLRDGQRQEALVTLQVVE